MELLTEEQKRVKLSEIANKLGTTVSALLENSTPDAVIEAYLDNKYNMLMEA